MNKETKAGCHDHGVFDMEDNDFTRLVLAEIEAAHEADRQAALSEDAS